MIQELLYQNHDSKGCGSTQKKSSRNGISNTKNGEKVPSRKSNIGANARWGIKSAGDVGGIVGGGVNFGGFTSPVSFINNITIGKETQA